ncbi:MAG TPA: hypothetical protein VGO67_19955 [Verrucomicrobiae bacterium]
MFFKKLKAAPSASSADEASRLVVETLNSIEDEFSGVPYRPENWRSDGRMYPSREDSLVKFPERPSLLKYRNKGHYNYIGPNGSIRVETLDGKILLDKPGQDGRKTHDLDF